MSQKSIKFKGRLLGLAMCALTLGLGASAAQAQKSFPEGPVSVIVSFPAGGSTDGIARELSRGLTEIWGTSVYVDNRPGASGVIALDAVAKSPPDGHTLFVALYDTLVITPHINRNMQYDTLNDITPFGQVATIPLVLVTHPDSGITSVEDIITKSKAKPDSIDYATTGYGGGQHLSMERFQQLAGIKLNHIPYKGVAQGLQDVVAGRVSLMLASPSTAMTFLRDGRLVPLAYASSSRSSQLPSVPTFVELGFADFEPSGWMGVIGPKGVPEPLVEKISRDIETVVSSDRFREALANQGNQATFTTPAEMKQRINTEHESFGKLVSDLGGLQQ